MLNYRHVPFAVFRQQCGGVGEAGLKRYDIMNGEDGLAGLGVPAKAITILNYGPGILYYQISSNGRDISVVDGIDPSQDKGYAVHDGIYIAVISMFSDDPDTTFSIIAIPGIWTEDEYIELMEA